MTRIHELQIWTVVDRHTPVAQGHCRASTVPSDVLEHLRLSLNCGVSSPVDGEPSGANGLQPATTPPYDRGLA